VPIPQPTVLPDNVVLDGVAPPGVPPASSNWDDFDHPPESVTVTANRDPVNGALGDFASNTATGVARIPGAVLGTPHMLAHTADWLMAHIANTFGGTNLTGADVDKYDPLAVATPTSDTIDKGVFKSISAVAGRDVQPYEPTSVAGKLWQAAITGAGAGIADPLAVLGAVKASAPAVEVFSGAMPRMAKTAIAASASDSAQQLDPDSPVLPALAAFLAYTGASAGETAARFGGGVTADGARQVFSPTTQGETEAGRALKPVATNLPGLAVPSPSDLTAGTDSVRAATDAIGPGQLPWQAGAQLRAGLQQRSDALRTARSQAGDTAYDAFRAQPALPSTALEPLMRSPGFRRAVGAANAAVLDEGGEPMTDYWDFDAAGDPALKSNAAIPPDVLGRVKS